MLSDSMAKSQLRLGQLRLDQLGLDQLGRDLLRLQRRLNLCRVERSQDGLRPA